MPGMRSADRGGQRARPRRCAGRRRYRCRGSNCTMSITTNRRSFLFGASVAGFGIFARGGRAGRGASGRTSAEHRLHRRRRQGRAATPTTSATSARSSPSATSTRSGSTRRPRSTRSEEVRRLPQAARRAGPEDRRRGRLHARPHARRGRRHGDAAGQARLLPEAADALALRGPPDARDGPPRRRSAPRWATRGRPQPGLPPRASS